eukprot:m.367632 g.367632  ORF g.367632 m.367632 type:complete len:125 (-) comp56085_c0_seq1:1954-2328(-)
MLPLGCVESSLLHSSRSNTVLTEELEAWFSIAEGASPYSREDAPTARNMPWQPSTARAPRSCAPTTPDWQDATFRAVLVRACLHHPHLTGCHPQNSNPQRLPYALLTRGSSHCRLSRVARFSPS